MSSLLLAAGPALAQLPAAQTPAPVAPAPVAPAPAAVASPAAPTPPESEASSRDRVARDLQERGKLEWSRKAYAEAAALFAASQEQVPMAGTSLLLADCYEHLGKLRSARDAFRRAEALALATKNADLAERARIRAAALEPRVPHIELRVSAPLPPGLLVTLNGVEVPNERLNTALPLDAGAYRVEVRAPEHHPFSVDVRVSNELLQPSARQVVPVVLTPLPRGWDQREVAWWIGGAGAAVGLVGIGLFIAAGVKKPGDCNADTGICETEKSRDDWNGARNLAQLATISSAIALPLLGAGAVLYFTADPRPESVGATLRWSGEF